MVTNLAVHEVDTDKWMPIYLESIAVISLDYAQNLFMIFRHHETVPDSSIVFN